ncbi:MAG: hypothetical protein U0Q18_34645 [Bryobacteraceae bacterium]
MQTDELESVTNSTDIRGRSDGKFWRYGLLAAVVLSLITAIVAAGNRPPWSDEGFFSSAAYNLSHRGFFGTTVLEAAGTGLTRIDQRTYWIMPIYPLGEALWYDLFPASLLSTRLYTIIWIPLALGAFYVFLSRLAAARVAALGTCLLALSYIFIDNASFARPDLMCCAFGLVGLALYLSLRESSLEYALLASNTFIAASGLTHPNGIYHFAGLLVLVVWFDRKRLSWRAIGAAAAPYLVFGAAWAIYILKDYSAFADQMKANGTNGRWTSTLNPVSIWWHEIRERYMVAFGLVTRGLALLKIGTLVAYWGTVLMCIGNGKLRRRGAVRLLLTMTAVYFVGMAVFNQKLSYYLIHIVPLYIALLAICIEYLWTGYPRWRSAIALAVTVLVAGEIGGIFVKSYQRSYQTEQIPAVQFALSRARPADRIDGSAALIYAMGFDRRLKDDYHLGLISGRQPDIVIVEPLYKLLYSDLERERPAEMAQVRERLAEYTLAYRNGDYDVYLRRR